MVVISLCKRIVAAPGLFCRRYDINVTVDSAPDTARLAATRETDTMHKLFAAALPGLVATTAQAELMAPAPPVVVRGTIDSVTGNVLGVTSKTGEKLTVVLAPDAKVAALSVVGIDAIQPGSFIGTAAKPRHGAMLEAVEVHVFPPSMRGLGEGHRAWDLGKNSSMTNGDVGSVKGSRGRTIMVNYKGGQQQVYVPKSVPIVAFADGTLAQLVPGAHLFAFTKKLPDGRLATNQVAVGVNGVVPPM